MTDLWKCVRRLQHADSPAFSISLALEIMDGHSVQVVEAVPVASRPLLHTPLCVFCIIEMCYFGLSPAWPSEPAGLWLTAPTHTSGDSTNDSL